MNDKKEKQRLHRWEIVLMVVATPILYLAVCFLVTRTEYNYPHRYLIHMFDSRLIPYAVILGFDILWIIIMKVLPFGSRRAIIILTLLILILSAVAITDIYLINMWHHMMA